MSKRSRRRFHPQPQHRQVITERRDPERENQILNAQVSDVASNHPVIRQLMDRLAGASEQEALNIGLVLQQILRGDASLLSNQDKPKVAETIQKLKAEAEAKDAADKAWDENQMKFATEVIQQSEKLIPDERTKEKEIAKGMDLYAKAQQMAGAHTASKRLTLQWHIENDPKVDIFVSGHVRNTSQGTKVFAEEINILDKKWVLPPGMNRVPQIIADRYQQKLKGQEELAARQNAMLLTKGQSHDDIEKANRVIDQQFGTPRDNLPLRGE